MEKFDLIVVRRRLPAGRNLATKRCDERVVAVSTMLTKEIGEKDINVVQAELLGDSPEDL